MSHQFGNINLWTKDKLERLKKYLAAYTKALSKTQFKLAYIDAFAGTGTIDVEIKETTQTSLLFDDFESETTTFIDGSAKIALKNNPPFHKYIFVEKNQQRYSELQKLKNEFPQFADKIDIVKAEANEFVRQICRKDWVKNNRRAVMFLDPYGMQVEWSTLEAIAKTQAIDLWILFPIGSVNRLLNKNARIKEVEEKRLDILFGSDEWFTKFFNEEEFYSVFTDSYEKRIIKVASFESIAEYFIKKLKTVFAEVAINPLPLTNSNNSPIFLLCFAAGNPVGAPIAVKIAENVLK